ncbi:MAG: hypothetical protein ACSHYF_09245 [Verrucomicrobiaceae bacterium]
MNAIAITLFVSMILAGIFIICFSTQAFGKKRSSAERDSLLPLQDDES